MPSHKHTHASTARRAFTLTELIAAIAIVLVMMAGVSYVFTATSGTIGTGMAVSSAVRAMRATESTLRKDFALATPVAGETPMPSLVINSQENDLLTTNVYGSKADEDTGDNGRFRTDTFSYFQSGSTFNRRTADNGYLTSDGTASDAWVWLGHLDVATGSGAFAGPGAGTVSTNRDNFYANSWTLGRVVMLLRPAANMTAAGDTGRIAQTTATPLEPLGFGATGTGGVKVYDSRFDQAEWSRDAYLASITTAGATWWTHLTDRSLAGGTYRFRYDGFPQRPLTSQGAASSVPVFVPNCREFIVEFAGDMDGNGDGLDRVDVTSGPLGDSDPATRNVQWYGFPRDVDGDGHITAAGGDVIPVAALAGTPQPYEVAVPSGLNNSARDYGTLGTPPAPGDRYVAAWNASMPATVQRPKLIRITVKLADSNGRLSEPQTMEMVFNVP